MKIPALRFLPFTGVLIVSSLIIVPDSSTSVAAPDVAIWSAVSIPAEGTSGKWQLAAGSDVKMLTITGNGTLYAYANPTGSNNTLFKSADRGLSWTPAGQIGNSTVALVTTPNDSKIVYYATNTTVYRSLNSGVDFSALGTAPGGAGSNNISITCLALGLSNNSRIVAIGTADRDAGQFGGVYTWNESDPSANWSDTALINCDVLSVAFSPKYSIDKQLIAAGSSESGTVVAFRTGDSGWGMQSGNATINGFIPENCVAAFPGDYNDTFFLGVDSGNGSGDVFRISRTALPGNSDAVDLNIGGGYNVTGVDVSGLDVSGSSANYYLLAGASDSSTIYASSDGGQNWSRSSKSPTGDSETIIAMAPDFSTSGRVYAGSSGSGSAFSCSIDSGITWNQLGLIDTGMDAIVDFTVSPRYAQDKTLFLLTWGGEHSLWRTQNSGNNWERVYTGGQAGASSFSHSGVSPQYGSNESVVVVSGDGGSGAIWKSNNKGQTFVGRTSGFPIDTLAIADNDQYFAGTYDGTNSLVYRTTDGGSSYNSPALAGSQPLTSIKLSPSFLQDRTILAGNSNGWVFLSKDSGASFLSLPAGSITPPLTNNVFVVFDWQFAATGIIYAASDNTSTSSSRSRLYRYTIGNGQQWENLDSTLEVGGKLGELCVLPGGSLYAANSHDNGGMERSLNPGAANYPTFERISSGLSNGAALWGLWNSGNQIWSIDTRNSQLMTYVDSLIAPVVLGNPISGASGLDTRNVVLDWAGLAGAITYEWQVDDDASFSSVSSSLKGETPSTLVKLPNLDPAGTYYWRVRVKEPTLSPWSPVRYFYTILGRAGTLPELYSPKAAADGVGLNPVFQWAAINGAERYELLIAADSSFGDPVIAKIGSNALTTNAWQCNTSLTYNTTYFWKIRGVDSNSYSQWSGVGIFTTLLPPVSPPPPLASYKVLLLSPKTDMQGVGTSPVFEWSAVQGADLYELLVSTNRSFVDAVIAKIGAGAVHNTIWQSDISLQYGTTYYWKVRGVGGGNTSKWSDDRSFTTVAAPAAQPDPQLKRSIELVFPNAGAQEISISPIFQWKAVSGADKYELLVSTNYSFDNTIIKKDGTDYLPVAVWQSDVDLAYGTTYFWKVRAIGGANTSAWSDPSAFITVGPPRREFTAIELENPAPGAEGISLQPVFQWKPVSGVERYELLVSASGDFADPVIVKTGSVALAANAWRSNVSLVNNTTYYWKVTAILSSNHSVWSNVSAFTTVCATPKTEARFAGANTLPRAELNSSVNADGRAGIKPSFSWKAVPGADNYELLVSPDIAFAMPVIIRVGDYALPGISWKSEIALNYDSTYFWKVRAVSENITADWSVPGVFITQPGPVQMPATDRPGMPDWAIVAGATLIAIIVLLSGAIVTLLTKIKSG